MRHPRPLLQHNARRARTEAPRKQTSVKHLAALISPSLSDCVVFEHQDAATNVSIYELSCLRVHGFWHLYLERCMTLQGPDSRPGRQLDCHNFHPGITTTPSLMSPIRRTIARRITNRQSVEQVRVRQLLRCSWQSQNAHHSQI